MQWSKLKTRVKDFIHPELKDRIDFHLTSYRKSHDGADKIWITIDGEKVFSCKHYAYEFGEGELFWFQGKTYEEAEAILRENEIHRPADFGNAMRNYFDLPIAEALKSANPFIRAFAIVDSRTGKRALEKQDIGDSEHTLVKAFYDLRSAQTS